MSFILAHQPTSLIHYSPSTEHKFDINMYHPNTTSSSQYSTISNNHANAITPSAWFVNLYDFKPPENTPLPSKLELYSCLTVVPPFVF